MSDIYKLHDAAFSRVSAFVILKDGERVATVAIKYPADGAGRLWAYCHYIGAPMQRAFAGGYGYDKRTPAVADAFHKARFDRDHAPGAGRALADFKAALQSDSGIYWNNQLEAAGFVVLQAV